jgi:hypothetical protein
VQDTTNGLRVSEHASHLAHGTVIVDSRKFAGIKVSIPISHVDNEVIILGTRVIKFGEEAAGAQVVVILIDLAESITDFEVGFEVIHPVALGTVDWYTAIGALEMRMGRGEVRLAGVLSRFWVVRRDGGAGLLVTWVRAESILLYEFGALADSV